MTEIEMFDPLKLKKSVTQLRIRAIVFARLTEQIQNSSGKMTEQGRANMIASYRFMAKLYNDLHLACKHQWKIE